MFGTVRPKPCALDAPSAHRWRELYCGTCLGMGTHVGLLARPIVSYDAVLLAALVDGLADEPAEGGACRCPLNPLVHRPALVSDTVPMRVATGVQVLLADQWLADHAADGSTGAALARPLLSAATPTARALLSDLGLDPRIFDGLAERQLAVEAGGAAGPLEAAEPTEDLLRYLLRGVAGLSEGGRACVTTLESLGAALGRAVYLVDALDDLERDARTGAFNPCLAHGPGGILRPDAGRVEVAIGALEEAATTLALGARRLPWQRNATLVRHALEDRLPARVSEVSVAARRAASEAGVAALAAWRALPWYRRLTATILAWWARFTGRPALAAGPDHPGIGDLGDEESPDDRRRRKRRRQQDIDDAGAPSAYTDVHCCEGCAGCADACSASSGPGCGDRGGCDGGGACGLGGCDCPGCDGCGCGGCDCGGCDCGPCDCGS